MLPFDLNGIDMAMMAARFTRPAELDFGDISGGARTIADAIAWSICVTSAEEQVRPIDFFESNRSLVEMAVRQHGERIFAPLRSSVVEWLNGLDRASDTWQTSVSHGAWLTARATNYADDMLTRIEDVLLEVSGLDHFRYRNPEIAAALDAQERRPTPPAPAQLPSGLTPKPPPPAPTPQQQQVFELIAREMQLKIHSPQTRWYAIGLGFFAVTALIGGLIAHIFPAGFIAAIFLGFLAVRQGVKYSREQNELTEIRERLTKRSV